MKTKCLLCFGSDNYILLLQGNSFEHLLQAIKGKTELWAQINANEGHDYVYEIFDADFNTFARLEETLAIEHLSRIRIRDRRVTPPAHGSQANLIPTPLLPSSTSKPCPSSSAFFVRSPDGSFYQVPEPKLFESYQSEREYSFLPSSSRAEMNGESPVPVVISVNPHQTVGGSTDEDSSEQRSLYEKDDDHNFDIPSSPPPAPSLEVEWPPKSVTTLLDCCKRYKHEIMRYDCKKSIWDRISHDLREQHMYYASNQCCHKFARLRSTYINIICYPNILQETQWPFLTKMKELLGENASEIMRPQHSSSNKREKHHKELQVSGAYLMVIQLVRKYINEFSNPQERKYETWKKISLEMQGAGYNLNPKSCQGLFHRLRYNYLHLLRTICDEESAQRKWPYFNLFQDIDLTPFRTRGKTQRRKRMKGTNKDPAISITVSSSDPNEAEYEILQQGEDDNDEDNEDMDEYDDYEDDVELSNFMPKKIKPESR